MLWMNIPVHLMLSFSVYPCAYMRYLWDSFCLDLMDQRCSFTTWNKIYVVCCFNHHYSSSYSYDVNGEFSLKLSYYLFSSFAKTQFFIAPTLKPVTSVLPLGLYMDVVNVIALFLSLDDLYKFCPYFPLFKLLI